MCIQILSLLPVGVAGSGLQPLPNVDSMTSSNNSATGLKPSTSTDSPDMIDKDSARGQVDGNDSRLLACASQLAVWLLVSRAWHIVHLQLLRLVEWAYLTDTNWVILQPSKGPQ